MGRHRLHLQGQVRELDHPLDSVYGRRLAVIRPREAGEEVVLKPDLCAETQSLAAEPAVIQEFECANAFNLLIRLGRHRLEKSPSFPGKQVRRIQARDPDACVHDQDAGRGGSSRFRSSPRISRAVGPERSAGIVWLRSLLKYSGTCARREGLSENHAKPNSKWQFPSQNQALRGVAEYFNRLLGTRRSTRWLPGGVQMASVRRSNVRTIQPKSGNGLASRRGAEDWGL